MQGVGAVGVATIGGSAVISAQEGGDGGGEDSAAFRVAHASPDAPNVDVRLNRADGGGGQDGNGGGQNGDGGDQGGDGGGQNGDGNGGGQDGEADVQLEGIGFRQVSSYNEVQPGTYRVEVLPSEGGLLGGLLSDLFGGGDEDQTTLFEQEVDLQAGTAYTVVAFGEVRQGPVPAEEGEMAQTNETDGQANETAGQGNETESMGNETEAMENGNETEAMENGNETEAMGNETAGGDGQGEVGEQIVENLGFGEHETVELSAGDYTLLVNDAAGGQMDATPAADEAQDGNQTAADGNETDGNETAGQETGADGQMADGAGGQPFQVSVLEDDVSDPGEGNARVRLFHAVPDVEAVNVTAVADEELAQEDGGGGAGGNATGGDQPGNATGDGGAGNQPADGAAGNQPADGAAGDQGGEPGTAGEDTRRAVLSVEGQTVYSGFAVGYFDAQAATPAGEGGEAGNETAGTGNETGDGAANQTDGMGNETGDGNQTAGGNETAGDGADEEGEEVAEDPQGEEFELVTVQDAQGGERSDGGTDGILSFAPANR